MSRPSPSESATLFKIGTIKKGNDGNLWIISEASNGVKRWKSHKTSNNQVKIKNNSIIEFKLPSIKKFIKEGDFEVESDVCVGEFSYHPKDGFSKFGKGTYFIYRADDNLILSKNKIDKKDVLNTKWVYTDVEFGVDSGSFGFWDIKYIKGIADYDKKRRSYNKNGIPHFTSIWDKRNGNDTFFISINDLDDGDEYVEYGFDGDHVIGILRATGTGDGTFGCYVNDTNTMLFLLGGNTSMELYDGNDMPPHLEVVQKYKKRNSTKRSRKISKKIMRNKARRSRSRRSRSRKNSRKSRVSSKRQSKRKSRKYSR